MEGGQQTRIRDDTVVRVFIKGKFAALVLGLARREFEPDCSPRCVCGCVRAVSDSVLCYVPEPRVGCDEGNCAEIPVQE